VEQKMEILKKCPICGSNKLEKAFKTKDYFLTQKEFEISKCKSCGFHFTNPRPTESSLGEYYKSEEYISHSNSNKGLFGMLYQSVRNYTLKKKYQLVSRLKDGHNILDIGCATGQFLHEFKDRGWKCTGIEPDENARKFAQKKYDLKIFDPIEINNLKDHSFDVISMWHVLEHVSDLKSRMMDLQRLLKENGYLFIALPNFESWDAKHYGEYWAGLDVPRHLYHFNKKNVELLFKNYGFKIVDIKAMKFDSYYVSLLSEKYKKNPLYLLSAFFKGWYSNLKAGKTSPNHSSLLYILKPIVV